MQRTAPRVTAPALFPVRFRSPGQVPRRAPQSLSLGSLDALERLSLEIMPMSVPGLRTMNELLATAAAEVEQWQQSANARAIPPHRITGIRDKIQALRGCGSVGLLRTGFVHVFDSANALGVPISELAPSLLRLAALLNDRQR